MTCIVGLVDRGRIYLGGDSAGVCMSGLGMQVRKDKKVFKNGVMVMGFTSSFRMGQLLQYDLKVPRHPSKMDDMKYMSSVFVSAVRKCLKKGGYASKRNEEESGGTFLVGYHGSLFEIADDYQVAQLVDNYAAVGCGAPIALGSLFSTNGRCIMAKQRVITALQSAERWSAGVRGPFNIVEI